MAAQGDGRAADKRRSSGCRLCGWAWLGADCDGLCADWGCLCAYTPASAGVAPVRIYQLLYANGGSASPSPCRPSSM
jgi:hypothetical protein